MSLFLFIQILILHITFFSESTETSVPKSVKWRFTKITKRKLTKHAGTQQVYYTR